jgi:hypothetical protein
MGLTLIFSGRIIFAGQSIEEAREKHLKNITNPSVVLQPSINKQEVPKDEDDIDDSKPVIILPEPTLEEKLASFEETAYSSLASVFGEGNFSLGKNIVARKYICDAWIPGYKTYVDMFRTVSNVNDPMSLEFSASLSGLNITITKYLESLDLYDYEFEMNLVDDVLQKEVYATFVGGKQVVNNVSGSAKSYY